MEQVKTAVAVNNLSKKFKGFTLDIPCLKIPQGFATAPDWRKWCRKDNAS